MIDLKTSNIFTSQNEFLSQNDEHAKERRKIYETIKEKNKGNKKDDEKKFKSRNRIGYETVKDDTNTQSSKRTNENVLLLKKNTINNKDKHNFEKNRKENNHLSYQPNQKFIKKNDLEEINENETFSDIGNNENNVNNINNNDIYMENKEEINNNDIFNIITGYDIYQKIKLNYVKLFFFNSLPKGKTLNTNINKIKKENNENNININFNFNLEILRNNKIYYFAKIKKTFPSCNIKIFIKITEDEYMKVGKIISNFLRNNFIVYKGDNKNNYQKVLNINYDLNFFGTKVRNMTVEKKENNEVSYVLCNDSPEWDYEYKTYKLNFNGRVKKSCKKNFILKIKNYKNNKNEEEEDDNINNERVIQCGKIDDNSFALDFISPLSPFEAFTLSISSIIYKFLCE